MDKLGHIRQYGSEQGYVTELCHLSEMPELWLKNPIGRMYHLRGLAGRTQSGNLRAIVAHLGDSSPDLLAAALAHEIGHLHQFRDNLDKGDLLDLEINAWEWAMSELSFTPEMAELALTCLNCYRCPNNHQIMVDLWKIVEG